MEGDLAINLALPTLHLHPARQQCLHLPVGSNTEVVSGRVEHTASHHGIGHTEPKRGRQRGLCTRRCAWRGRPLSNSRLVFL